MIHGREIEIEFTDRSRTTQGSSVANVSWMHLALFVPDKRGIIVWPVNLDRYRSREIFDTALSRIS
jgi:hypothetical protein